MAEKILIAASMAALVCHPSASIKCFKPKSKASSAQGKTSKPNTKKDVRNGSSLFRTSVFSSCSNVDTALGPHVLNHIPSTSSSASCLVSNLSEEDPAFKAVETVFKSGWDGKVRHKIDRILKMNHSMGVLKKFEEYRETVKSKYANTCQDQELAADGNELLRFHGAIVTCSLGNNGLARICSKKSCGVCRLVKSVGSAGKEPVAVSNDSRGAHRKVTKECSVSNSACGRKAIVVCRVVAGRVARCRGREFRLAEGGEGGFDSVLSLSKDRSEGSEELIALNARAVLPCYVIFYNVKRSKYYNTTKSSASRH